MFRERIGADGQEQEKKSGPHAGFKGSPAPLRAACDWIALRVQSAIAGMVNTLHFSGFSSTGVSVHPQTCWRTLGTRVCKCIFARAPELVSCRPNNLFIPPTRFANHASPAHTHVPSPAPGSNSR
jgi:hypothetical protein